MADKRGPLYKLITSYGAIRKVLTPEGRKAAEAALVQGPSFQAGGTAKKSPLRRMEAATRDTYKGQSDHYRVGKSPIQFRKD